jgi:ubiquinone/menaquinone biosynthesis C-methylase UbiE
VDKNSSEYIISGGNEGKSRLNVLSETLYEHTKYLLETQGVGTGKSLLDLGCGGGNVAIMAAKMVSDTGRVTGVDFDEGMISLARQDALAAGRSNISFAAGSAYDISYDSEFDFAYARFLLSHLERPMDVLQRMVRSVRPGGKIITEDVQFSGHFCYPACEAFDRYVQYYAMAARHNAQNPEIGPSLFSLFHEAGIKNTGFDVIQPCFSKGPGKWMAYLTLDRIKNTLAEQGIADLPTVIDLLAELALFTRDERTIISLPRIFRVWGEKEL